MGKASTAKRARRGASSSPYAPTGGPPPKIEGVHRWVMVLTYSLTNAQARAAMTGARVNLDGAPRVRAGVGCLDCNGEYQIVNGAACVPGLATPTTMPTGGRTASGLIIPEG